MAQHSDAPSPSVPRPTVPRPNMRSALPGAGTWLHRLAWAAVALALVVIVFGAFVRLSNAGLSCPDWPTCYGRAAWPTHADDLQQVNQAYPMRAVEPHKAWREQFHRHIAALLGTLVLALALLASRRRRFGAALVLGPAALVGAAIALYMARHYVASSALAALALLVLLACAWRWRAAAAAATQPAAQSAAMPATIPGSIPAPISAPIPGAIPAAMPGGGANAPPGHDHAGLATLALAVIIVQALLGMWTVTWLLKPAVVMAHLLGGLASLTLLGWLAWRTTPGSAIRVPGAGGSARLRPLLWVGLALLAVQIALGGWTSANYAALACGTDFPTCLGQWWPPTDFGEGFVLWRGIGVDYEGGVLDGPARTAIHMAHRLFAVLVFGHLLGLALRLRRTAGLGRWGVALGLLLGAQVALGISNVVYGLPLWVATAHNAGAALLLLLLVSLLARLAPPTR